MPSIDFSRRKARGGQQKLPPNPEQWGFEHNGLDLRDDLGIGHDERLPVPRVFELLPSTVVLAHGKVPAAESYLNHFRNDGVGRWSGLAVSMPDGSEVVLYNDAHPETRVRSTLMEEFFHLRLGHPRSSVRIIGGEDGFRTYNSATEIEAYASGAAALVPYGVLRRMIHDGFAVRSIARLFAVSEELVKYRLKVTKLFRRAVGRR